MNEVIYDISKSIKKVFNKVDLNAYLVGSYANQTEHQNSDINIHLYQEDFDFEKSHKLSKLLEFSLPQEIKSKIKFLLYDIKSLKTNKASLSFIEHYCRLYNSAHIIQNDFGLDPVTLRQPNNDLKDLCNRIMTSYSITKVFNDLGQKKISLIDYAIKFPRNVITMAFSTLFVTKSTNEDFPLCYDELANIAESFSVGIKDLSQKLLHEPSIENSQAFLSQFKEMHIQSIYTESCKDQFIERETLELYQDIHSSDRFHLLFIYKDLERIGEFETHIPNFYQQSQDNYFKLLNRVDENFKALLSY